MEKISRRNFLTGTTVGAIGAVVSGLAWPTSVSAAVTQGSSSFERSIDWDAEYDVIVAGYGAAGAAAAISAAENGARVLLLEKASKPFAGGNSRYGQNFMAHTDRDMAIKYMKNLREDFTKVQDDEAIEFLVDGFMTFYDWLIKHGVPKETIAFAYRPEYPERYPDTKFTGFRKITVRPDSRFSASGVNSALGTFRNIVESLKDKIDIWYGSPALSLVQDPVTKIIHGVRTAHGGKRYAVRAKNGVVLATGGFENNQEMVQNFTGYSKLVAKGCSFNTGDGVVMAQEVGAQLWHMHNGAMPDPNFVNPYTNCAFGWSCACSGEIPNDPWYGDMGAGSMIFVAGDGTRFMNEAVRETFVSRHGQTNFHGTWIHAPWPNAAYMVFDEQCRLAGHKPYSPFSDGLKDEIELGWIIKADTLAGLGEKIGIDGEAMAATIERYNRMCKNGLDEDCGRDSKFLVEFSGQGPYYAMKLEASVTNTDGGAKRNTRCEVLNPRNQPIPHLYSAGTFGSFFVGAYNGGGNMGENYVTGLEAGKNAAAAKTDVTQDSVMTKTAVKFPDERTQFVTASNQYLGRYWGMNGELTVRVTLSGEHIDKVEVLEQSETPNIGSVAVKEIPQRIINAQSTIVDTVAGATRTSAGIILAVEQALAKAGVKIQSSSTVTETHQ